MAKIDQTHLLQAPGPAPSVAGSGKQGAGPKFGRIGGAGAYGFDVDAPQFLPRGMQPRPPPTPPPPNTPVVQPGYSAYVGGDPYGASGSLGAQGAAAAATAALRGLTVRQQQTEWLRCRNSLTIRLICLKRKILLRAASSS